MSDQAKGILRVVLGWAGGLLLGWLVAHGATQADAASAVTGAINAVMDAIPTITALVSAIVTIWPIIWSAARHTEAGNAIAAADTPGVTVQVDPMAAPRSVLNVARDVAVPGVIIKPYVPPLQKPPPPKGG